MKILHLTDFHYKSDSSSISSQNSIVEALIIALKNEQEPIDFILFTGDLVNSGDDPKGFLEASTLLFEKLIKELNVPKTNFFICGGNHDVYRGKELKAITEYVDKFTSITELNSFIQDRDEAEQFNLSLVNIQNYVNFQNEFYNNINTKDFIEPLYTTHIREFKNEKIGIVCINTGWRSNNSVTDRGNLLFPTVFLKKAIDLIKETQFRIILLHHPISDLKEFLVYETEDLIYHNFHLMFSGHIHKVKYSTHLMNDEGILHCVSPATLSLNDNWSSKGFSILDIDTETKDFEIKEFNYDSNNNLFTLKASQTGSVPLSTIKQDQNKFRKTLRKKLKEAIEFGNELFISFNEQNKEKNFLKLFTSPILKDKPQAQSVSRNGKASRATDINFLWKSNGNCVIYGKDKSGKTSLLIKIQIEILKEFSSLKTVPLYIDCKQNRNLNIIKLIANYFEINNQNAEDLSNHYHIKLLIDNFNYITNQLNSEIINFLTKNKNSSLIICDEEKLLDTYVNFFSSSQTYDSFYIHDISRTEIRQLTEKWPNISKEKKENVLEKIYSIFKQLSIPNNYWTVSLFLWIFENTNEENFHNNVDLIQLYIDGLLEKKSFATEKASKITFDQLKNFLGELAHFLVAKSHDHHKATYLEIVSFCDEYRTRNMRFVIDVEDLLTLISKRGIIKKYDDKYTFRLNGVFEYFLAHEMTNNAEFRSQVINDDHYYLSFGNELELYSGFRGMDSDFVNQIFDKTKIIFKDINELFSSKGTSDEILLSKSKKIIDLTPQINDLKKGISLQLEDQDLINEEINSSNNISVEVGQKKFYEGLKTDSDYLQKALFILSRVFRNSAISDNILNSNVFNFILKSACNLGFQLIDELESNITNRSGFKEESAKKFLRAITNFMPLVIQVFAYDALAQNNLERLINDKISELKQDNLKNEFKLFILYFILIDLDLKRNAKYLDNAIDELNIGILKQSILIKLHMYIMFKTFKKPELEDFLKEKIVKISKKINSNTNVGVINNNLKTLKNKRNRE